MEADTLGKRGRWGQVDGGEGESGMKLEDNKQGRKGNSCWNVIIKEENMELSREMTGRWNLNHQ